ncbi:MAG: hypothetical protein JO262_22425 [Solirubrobacterales bacterium]|nr:hypothetical protein [Solirubrobacterales bacterium]
MKFPHQGGVGEEGGRNYDHVGVSSQEAVDRAIAKVAAKQREDIAFCEARGLPAPVMVVPLFGYIVDALFAAERVIVELDSWDFHKGKIPFEADRDRDADALADRRVTLTITWERIDERPLREARRLHTIVANRRALHAPSAA